MRVSLAPTRLKTPPAGAGEAPPRCLPLLADEGARVILGGKLAASGLAEPIAPQRRHSVRTARRLPRRPGRTALRLRYRPSPAAGLETRHRREDQRSADLLIGQPDFASEGRNAKGAVGAATLNVPTGVAAADGVLAVADAWNHRVLIWHGYPDAVEPAGRCRARPGGFHRRPRQSRRGSADREHAQLVLWRGHRRWASVRRRHRQPARARLGRASRRSTARRPIWCSASATSPPATRTPAAGPARSACAGRTRMA